MIEKVNEISETGKLNALEKKVTQKQKLKKNYNLLWVLTSDQINGNKLNILSINDLKKLLKIKK